MHVISATVVEADAKGAKVELAGGVEGYIRAADLTNEVAAGDVVEAKYTGVDRKARIVHLSVKAKDQARRSCCSCKREYQTRRCCYSKRNG